ncbi:MAG: hypothetical protein VYA34_15325 [Myxococcota bacterium]|nr:hypothetical protein [Myxococcota bacterium]
MEINEKGLPPAKTKTRSWSTLLISLVIAILVGLVLYLRSDINRRQFRLELVNQEFIIQKGLFLPYGFQNYLPKAASLAGVYDPLKAPKTFVYNTNELFDDRSELDRALFAIVSEWIRQTVRHSTDTGEQEDAQNYLSRLKRLPGISEVQFRELGTLGADLSYLQGKHILENMKAQLKNAETLLKSAIDKGTAYQMQSKALLEQVTNYLEPGLTKAISDLVGTLPLQEIPPPDPTLTDLEENIVEFAPEESQVLEAREPEKETEPQNP